MTMNVNTVARGIRNELSDLEREIKMIETSASKPPDIPLKLEELGKESEQIIELLRALSMRLAPYMPSEVARAVEDAEPSKSNIVFLAKMEYIDANLRKSMYMINDILQSIAL